MEAISLYSALVLTLLLVVGFVSFLRGAVKERTTVLELTAAEADLARLRTYFLQRGFSIRAIAPEREVVTLVGQVRPSWGLAVFLVMLTAVAIACLGVVVGTVLPDLAGLPWLAAGSPVVGVLYWWRANRQEEVQIQWCPPAMVRVRGHKDELTMMGRSLGLVNKPDA
ncbi:MAG: cofactor assembly of complex C subunit B [Oscillatoriales cyanobacterium SM2_2_1]|nr:cofactor assembly of complex C subunit B [Oscillatoriales cyanobacterium SM2_2_1]